MPTYGTTSYRVGGTSHSSSSLRNPCPDNTGIGYGTFNFNGTDIIMLYCDSAFYNGLLNTEDTKLALGLGLGLGIPFLFIVIWICWANEACCFNKYRNYSEKPSFVSRLLSNKVEQTTEEKLQAAKQVVNKLPSSILHDFERGLLSEQLRQELMLLRIETGSDLTDYAMVAESQKHRFLAWWIRDMNPGSFPPEFQRHWREIRAGTYQIVPEPSAPSSEASTTAILVN